jgi:predicted AlkP superfamily phosphohydrolase/phosphomutase
MTTRRMMLIGLDAADSRLVEKWCDEGILPALSFLRAKGVWISLSHDRPMPSASIWPSISSGTYPGQHGIYNGLQLVRGKQELGLVQPDECGQPPFWRTLDENGKVAIIIDVPFDYALRDFGGMQILDWGSYERHYRPHSLPDEMLTEISKRFGAYPFGQEMSRNAPSSARHFSRVRAELLAGTAVKGNAIRWLMSRRSWDFLMVVFSETHPAGHYFWGFHARGNRESVSSAVAEFATTIKDVYRAADAEIGKIIESLDAKTALVVLSGQGMGPNTAKWHLLPRMLSELGLLAGKKESKNGGGRLARLRESIPLSWRRSVSRRLPAALRDRLRLQWAHAGIDWARTRAFHLPTDLLGYVRVNLKGREPRGVVEPGAEYHEVCDRISDALVKLTDPQTGMPAVCEVYRTDQLYPGPQRHRLPDLIVSWQDEHESGDGPARGIDGMQSGAPDPRSGNHRPEGFAIFYGPGTRSCGASPAHIVDIAPTVLGYFGLKPPRGIDGRDLLKAGSGLS